MELKEIYAKVFRPRPPIRELAELADFVDEHSAFIVQKGIYEYSRARAGHYSKVLFGERDFLDAVDAARWRAYPLGLAMVGEMVEGVLRPDDQKDQLAIAAALTSLLLSVFDRYPTPSALDAATWRAERDQLSLRLERVSLHPRKPVMDIPEPLARTYFNLMPIHKSLRGPDFPTLKNYLRITLCNVHDELTKRMDVNAVGEQLRARTG